MVIVRNKYVLKRVPCKGHGASYHKKRFYRDWWLVKNGGMIKLSQIYFPEKYWGKRIRIKIEVMK